MKRVTQETFIYLAIIVAASLAPNSFSADQTARGIGSGVIFAAPNLGPTMNPTAVLDSPTLSLLGLYRFDPKKPVVSLTTSAGIIGAGALYRQEGEDINVFEGSAAISGAFISLGGTFRKVDNQAADGDVALMFDFGVVRLGAIFRNIDAGANRIDGGIAFRLGSNAYLEVDLKKARPWDQNVYAADASIVLHAHDWTVGLGYDFILLDGELYEDNVHGGISLMLMESLYIDAHYRLHTQEWNADHWTAGARILF